MSDSGVLKTGFLGSVVWPDATGNPTTDQANVEASVAACFAGNRRGLVGKGTYVLSRGFVPAPGTFGNYTSGAGLDLVLDGQGAYQTIFQMENIDGFGSSGLVTYGGGGHNPQMARCIFTDIGWDGNNQTALINGAQVLAATGTLTVEPLANLQWWPTSGRINLTTSDGTAQLILTGPPTSTTFPYTLTGGVGTVGATIADQTPVSAQVDCALLGMYPADQSGNNGTVNGDQVLAASGTLTVASNAKFADYGASGVLCTKDNANNHVLLTYSNVTATTFTYTLIDGTIGNTVANGTLVSQIGPVSRPHILTRCRYFRPEGFGCKTFGYEHFQCMWDQCGQPNSPIHQDNNSGGVYAYMAAYGCFWKSSAGNIVDMVGGIAAGVVGATPVKCILQGNKTLPADQGNNSTGGQIAMGIYGLGVGSSIVGNDLYATVSLGGLGYDTGTALRANNTVALNNFGPNFDVANGGISKANGDVWFGNTSADQAGMDVDPFTTAPTAPVMQGLLGWTGDPMNPQSNVVTTSGFVWLSKVPWPVTAAVTNILVMVNTAGSGLTAAENLLAIYSSAGALLASTGDQTTNFESAAGSVITAALTGGPVTIPADPNGFVWVGMLQNGTTPMKPAGYSGPVGAQAGITNLGLTAAKSRGGTSDAGGAHAALPGNITPANIQQGKQFWAALS